MTTPYTTADPNAVATAVGRYRWVICALIFLATTVNYIDRQILALIKDSSTRNSAGPTTFRRW